MLTTVKKNKNVPVPVATLVVTVDDDELKVEEVEVAVLEVYPATEDELKVLTATVLEMVLDPRHDSPLYDNMADTAAQLLPKAIEYGVPGAEGLDVTSVAERVRAEMDAVGYAMPSPTMVSAWCSKSA